MQTVLMRGPVGRHFDIPDVFKEFLYFDSVIENQERILIFGGPYIISLLKGYIFWNETFKYHVKTSYDHFIHMITPPVLLRNGLVVTENHIDIFF